MGRARALTVAVPFPELCSIAEVLRATCRMGTVGLREAFGYDGECVLQEFFGDLQSGYDTFSAMDLACRNCSK